MEFRIFELIKELNAIIDKISNYCDKHEFEIDIKEITHKQDYIPTEYMLKKDPNIRRSEGIASYGQGVISFSPLSSQMIWYIAWLSYRIKDNNNDNNDDYIIQQLIVVDKGENNAPLNQLPDWDSGELDNIFCYAMGFLICHELGHAVFHHPSYFDEDLNPRDPALLRGNELEADSFAARCILEISNNDEAAKYGILVAQLAILFIRNENVTYDTHPEPATRLENIRQYFDFTDVMHTFIEIAQDLSQKYLVNRFVH